MALGIARYDFIDGILQAIPRRFPMLHFAIEASCLADERPTGIGRYAKGLIAGLAGIDDASRDYDLTALYRISRRRRRHQIGTLAGRVRRQSWRGQRWPLTKPYALVHATADWLPRWSGPLRVSTVHDVYAAVGINFDDELKRRRMLAHYRELASWSDFIVFVSEHSREDFLRLIGFDESRTAVTPLGVDAHFRPPPAAELGTVHQRHRLDRPYLLFVGLTNPNKNLPRLLEAYSRSAARGDCLLAIVGPVPDDQRAPLEAVMRTLGVKEHVRLTGYVADADIPALYGAASALLFPSLYEGFGLPILEAMACGTPVLTSLTTACPATAGGHALLVDPASVDAITRGIDTVVKMKPAQREAARVHAQSCSWRLTAEITLAAYYKTLELGRR